MGMQQLLLITVGVIIVALMIFTGINLMRSYFETANRDQLISTLYDLGVLAQQHYKKPTVQGGGGSRYTGWTIPRQLRNTQAGTIRATVRPTRIDFTATGKEIGRNNRTVVRITSRVNNNGIRITITN
ncbi:MAG: hypothetical protein HYS25_14480 [Ignavibacteriales bacterium]|nr:hypothetical protein [Ignavibacteriales bacterium]